MELSREVRFSLPRHVNINRISYHVKLPSGLSSPMGETHLLSHHGRLVVLTRNSAGDSLQPIGMSAAHKPKLLHEEWQDVLLLRGDKDQRYRIPLSNSVVGPVAYLLEETKGEPPETLEADDHTPGQSDEELEPEGEEDAERSTSDAPSFTLITASEPTPDIDIIPTDPESVLEAVGVYLGAGKISKASSWARTVPEMSLFHGAEADEVIGVIDALENKEPAEAFLRAELSDHLRVGIHDGALKPIADAFAQRGELVWAGAALSAALEHVDEMRLAQVFRHLGKDSQREEHQDWLLSELEHQRSDLIANKIVETRGDSTWRELRARLAGRRGGHALALRELKILVDRFPGKATIEAARLRAMWDSHQRDLFDRLLERCARDYAHDPKGLMHITRVAKDLGASPAQIGPFCEALAELAPDDPMVRFWKEQQSSASNANLMWLALGAGSAAVAAAVIFLL